MGLRRQNRDGTVAARWDTCGEGPGEYSGAFLHLRCDAGRDGFLMLKLVTSALVIAESDCLIDRQLGPEAEARLFDSIGDGSLLVEDLEYDDWPGSPSW